MHAMCRTLHFHMWSEYISGSIESADLQSCYGFHYILFNSTTSWQIRNQFKFRGKSWQIWCVCVCDDSPGRCFWKWATHEQSSKKTLSPTWVFLSVSCAEEFIWKHICLCYANENAHSLSKHAANFPPTHHSVSEVTDSTVAAEFLVFMWVVLPYLGRPVDLGPMKDDLLPRIWMPGWSSLLLLTSLPGSWSSSSCLLFCSSP